MNHARALASTALVALIMTAEVFALHGDPRGAAVATGIVLIATSALVVLARPRITHASTLFMALFVIYTAVVPWIYVTGQIPFLNGEFFVHNWTILARGNVIAEAGLLAYGCGLWLGRRIRLRSRLGGFRTIPYSTACQGVVALAIVGALAWAFMFWHEGFPISTLLGQPAHGRARIASTTAGGYGYLLNFSYASTLALFLYVAVKPTRSLLAPSMLCLYILIWLADGLIGSRLLLVVPFIGALFIRILRNEHARPGVRIVSPVRRRRIIQLVAAAAVLFSLTLVYETYRSAPTPTSSAPSTLKRVADGFATSGTFYMTLNQVPSQTPYWDGREVFSPVLYLIPHQLDPNKYNQIWDAIKFTKIFYGYDETQDNTNAQGPDLLADSYINGGVVGILVVLFCFGLANEIATRVERMAKSPLVTVLFVFYTVVFIQEAMKVGVFAAINFCDIRVLPFLVIAPFLRGSPSRARIHPALVDSKRHGSAVAVGSELSG